MRLKLRKTNSGTYYVPSLSLLELKRLASLRNRKWSLSKDGLSIILEGH